MNSILEIAKTLHAPSAAVGLAAGFLVTMGLVLAYKVGKLALKIAIAVVILTTLGGYLGTR